MSDQPKAWSTALTRRTALAAAGGLVASLASTRLATAQDATPVPADGTERIFTMFVQTAQAGAFGPKPGADGVFQLVLHGASAQTVSFSDRPHRIVGSVSTADFLAGLGFSEDNPPNAAIVAQTEQGEDVLVVELLNPVWDGFNQTLAYDVIVLDEYTGDGFGDLVQQQDDSTLPEVFGHTSLFIDDCPDITGCYRTSAILPPILVGPVPGGPYGACWRWSSISCEPCSQSQSSLNDLCNNTHGNCRGACIATG